MGFKNYRNVPRGFKPTGSGGGADSILSNVFRQVMNARKIFSMHAFNAFLNNYISNPANGIPQNIREKSSARGNLRKELLKSTMTWKVFMKGLRLMDVKFMVIRFEIHFGNREIQTIEQSVRLGNFSDSEDQELKVEYAERDTGFDEPHKVVSTINEDILS